jgi:uncharacterized repeat protein (TIGR01451 family)
MIPRSVSLALASVAFVLAALLPVSAVAAEPAPAWKLSLISLSTNFTPGSSEKDEYMLTATNVGGAPTSGEITLSDTLPEGLTPTAADGFSLVPPKPSCGIVDQTATCTTLGSLPPGHRLEVRIEVDVASLPEGTTLPNTAEVGGGGAAPVQASTMTTISANPASFGFLAGTAGLTAPLTDFDGSPATQAGSHPYQFTVDAGFPTDEPGNFESLTGAGHLRDFNLELPRGMIGNPAALPTRCTEAQLVSQENPGCPKSSQVGTITVLTILGAGIPLFYVHPLYNMVPPPGAPAAFSFDAVGAGIFPHIIADVRSDSDFGLSVSVTDVLALNYHPVFGTEAQLWSDASSSSHDSVRGICIKTGDTCPADEPQTEAFFNLPTDCLGQPNVTRAGATSWEEPEVEHEASYESADLSGNPTTVSGCNQLSYEPTITSTPTTNLAESPSGLDFHLHQPQDFSLDGLATAVAKDITVTLPEGMTLNPAAADGIEGCDAEQIGLSTPIGQSPAHFSKEPPSCPQASKLGTLEVRTPVLAQYNAEEKVERDPETGKPIPDPLFGSVYLAEPFENPFDSLLAIYLTVEDEETGIFAKVPGEITADPNTGQLVTTFSESPQLPLEDVDVHLYGGARAPLITPPVCGNHTTTTTISPWSSPEVPDAHPTDSFETNTSPSGGQCATSLGAAPNNPAFSAGTIDPVAGAYSPFVMKLTREDASQRLVGVKATLPPGLIGKLAGLAKCSEAQIAQAKSREAPNQGKAELAAPSCPASSEVGTVDVSAGAGPTPLYVKAHAYMAGPYKGAPLSLAIITPAVAGPFDLGAVVTRVALNLDSVKAQIHATSDPFPTILEGIPLDVRGAFLKLDRPDFTLNPTSCDPMAIDAAASTIPGQIASLRSPFQVGGCSGLGFKPKLAMRLKGGVKRGAHPAFQAIYKPRPGDANVKGIVVRLPRSAFLDQAHIRTICTRVQFAADACPPGAQYGSITAWTPLLEEPLQGPVYLRSSDNKLPDLVFDLHGVVDIEVATRIDSVKGGIRASIESAPDAPLTKVVLNMQGQKKGLIVNSRNICKGKNRADVKLDGQNGKIYDSKPKLRAKCGKKGRKRGGKPGHRR